MIPFFEVLLWMSLIFGVSGALAPTPLFYELSCEVAWPVPEETRRVDHNLQRSFAMFTVNTCVT